MQIVGNAEEIIRRRLEEERADALVAPPMRRIVPEQLGLVPAFLDHSHSREFAAISKLLDEHPEATKWSTKTSLDLAAEESCVLGAAALCSLHLQDPNVRPSAWSLHNWECPATAEVE